MQCPGRNVPSSYAQLFKLQPKFRFANSGLPFSQNGTSKEASITLICVLFHKTQKLTISLAKAPNTITSFAVASCSYISVLSASANSDSYLFPPFSVSLYQLKQFKQIPNNTQGGFFSSSHNIQLPIYMYQGAMNKNVPGLAQVAQTGTQTSWGSNEGGYNGC